MHKPHLLVVEDDTHLLEGIRAVLELDGFEISVAEHGAAALQLLCEHDLMPDLILSDIMMPEMDGLQFLREVRRQPRFIAIPFIFLTARGEQEDINTGKELGVDDYIVKPFEARNLIIAVRARLARHRALTEVTDTVITDVKRNILNVLNHEFRTPLTYIVAYADMLNQSQPEHLQSGDLLTFLHGVNSGALRLRRLVENFIQLVELETGESQRAYEMRKAPIDYIEGLFDQAIEILRKQSLERPFNPLAYDISDDIPVINADAEFLSIALSQLLDNAIKFSDITQPITLGAYRQGDELHLWVRDNGRGIEDKERDKIWSIFYQVNRAYYEDQGVGAGLPIVSGIARLHGGRVELQTEVNSGSIFTIVIPIQPAESIG
jgi:two-component system, sensor histidine kinase and response regulator